MSRFSIVIPCLDDIQRFEDTLASVLRYRPVDSQVIVVSDGRYSDPHQLRSEVQFVEADRGSGLIGHLNVGVCYCSGDFTTIIRPGVELDENWDQVVESVADLKSVASISPVLVRDDNPSRVLSAGVHVDSSMTRRNSGHALRTHSKKVRNGSFKLAGPTSWFGVYRTPLLKLLAPFDEQLDACYWDVDIAMSLRFLGFETASQSDFVAFVDSDKEILAEFSQAHGQSAARTSKRTNGPNRMLVDSLFDLVNSVAHPWRIKHFAQRWTAGQFTRIDNDYLKRLQMLELGKPWEVAESTTENSKSVSWRRAA